MRYETSVIDDDAIIRTNRPAEVARQLLDSADSPFDVRTITEGGVAFRVPLHVAEAAGFVHYPREDASTTTGSDTRPDTGGSSARTGDTEPEPTGNPSPDPQGASEASSDASAVTAPPRNGSQAAWSKFLTSQGIDHDEQASRDALIKLWDDKSEG